MDAAAGSLHFYRVLEVEHLVVEQVFDGVTGAGGTVEDLAYYDGVVCGVVVAQGSLGHGFAPCELGATHEAVEEAGVERVEDFFEVVVAAMGAEIALGAAAAADELGLLHDGGGGGEALVAVVLRGVNGLFVELGDEDVRDGAEDGFGCAFEQVREADVELVFAEADGGVEGDKFAETDVKWRHGRSRAECSVFFLEDGDEFGCHRI